MKAMHPNLQAVVELIDWDLVTKLPPWMSPIRENSTQGLAVVLGQSLKPDGTPPQVLIERAKGAKKLLDDGLVTKVMTCGSDPANVGHTEAFELRKVLIDNGIPEDKIIMEYQSSTTAENAWFALRWIPEGTGQVYIVTSDFHIPRATYIFQETFNYFYKMLEDHFRDDPLWTSPTKRYPRLGLHQVPVKSFCGSNASLNHDDDPHADVNQLSLRKRALNELTYLGDHEVIDAMYGEPKSKILYIWPIEIDVTQDEQNADNFRAAVGQAEHAAQSLCECQAPPEGEGPELPYPLTLPIPTDLITPVKQWQDIINTCTAR